MALKTKFIGLIIIIVGALPFLIKIEAIGNFITNYGFLEAIVPGSIIYQVIIVLLGLALIWEFKPHVAIGSTRH